MPVVEGGPPVDDPAQQWSPTGIGPVDRPAASELPVSMRSGGGQIDRPRPGRPGRGQDIVRRHQEQFFAGKADDFGLDRNALAGMMRQELPRGSFSRWLP